MQHKYTVAEIRNGTGWRTSQRFVDVDDSLNELETILIRARYKVLTAMRPLAIARDTYNLIIAEFAQEIRVKLGDTEADSFRAKVELDRNEDKFRTKVI